MIKPVCPRCETSLTRRSNGHVLQYACPNCLGFGSYFGAIGKLANPADAKQIWIKSETAALSELPCSFCRKPMRQILGGPSGDIELDVCRTCHALWFDFGEWEAAGGTALDHLRTDPNLRNATTRMRFWN